MTRAVLTPRAVWWRARAPVGLSKLCQLLALSAWHGIAQERSAGSSIKQISALTHTAEPAERKKFYDTKSMRKK